MVAPGAGLQVAIVAPNIFFFGGLSMWPPYIQSAVGLIARAVKNKVMKIIKPVVTIQNVFQLILSPYLIVASVPWVSSSTPPQLLNI